MSPFIISLMFAAGAATWIFTKFQRSSGNNTRQSAIAAGISGAVILVLFFIIFKAITK
jgi:hypothetical protein